MAERTDPRPSAADAYPPAEPPSAPPPYRPERLVKPRQPKPYPDNPAKPEPKYEDTRTTWRVRILPGEHVGRIRDIGGSAQPEQHLLKAGEVLELPIVIATAFVDRLGYGEWACKVRAIGNNISAGTYVLMAGDIAPCNPNRAGYYAAKGLVELVAEDTPTTLGGKAVLA